MGIADLLEKVLFRLINRWTIFYSRIVRSHYYPQSLLTCRCNCKALGIFIVSAATLTVGTLFILLLSGVLAFNMEKKDTEGGTGIFNQPEREWTKGNICLRSFVFHRSGWQFPTAAAEQSKYHQPNVFNINYLFAARSRCKITFSFLALVFQRHVNAILIASNLP